MTRKEQIKKDIEYEQLVYKIASRVLEWAEVKHISQEDVWNLVMLDLVNIK